jgi:guanylate kinase
MIVNSIDSVLTHFVDKKRIVLVGKAASGKDYARKLLQGLGYQYQISFTTRPMRVGEVHGQDYYFMPEFKFLDLVKTGFFYEHVQFNGWLYGTSKAQMKIESGVFIMTPVGLSHMQTWDRAQSLVVYFDIEEGIRKERLMLRSDADKVDRRLESDAVDFADFTNYDLKVNDPNFS